MKYENDLDFIKENNNVVESMGLHVQCVLNFADNIEDDGGTIIVPRFHKLIRLWCEVHADMKRPIPWLELKANDPMVRYGQRIPMREGSVLIWNQTMFHGKTMINGHLRTAWLIVDSYKWMCTQILSNLMDGLHSQVLLPILRRIVDSRSF